MKCNPIFSNKYGKLVVNNGICVKNVRKEFASLVLTPEDDINRNALSFTRSLGDFYMKTYGVTEIPHVNCIDLRDIQSSRPMLPGDIAGVLVIATDGLWDCYSFKELFFGLMIERIIIYSKKQ